MKLFILVAVLVGYGIALDRNITLVVENGWRNPDGYWRNTITINGQTPGPAIEATKGDRLFITVKNKMLREVTTIHWHGLLLPDATYDGGSMISQYPISPGQSFLYEITATNPGTHWYHSHIPLQYTDGLLGPLIVREPSEVLQDAPKYLKYDEERLIFLSEWFHNDAATMSVSALQDHARVWQINRPKSILFNGKGRCDCLDAPSWNRCDTKAPLEVVRVEQGKRYRLRIIAGGTRVSLSFSIEGHPLTVFNAQGEDVKPIVVETLDMAIGYRYDVLIEARQPIGNYWIAAQIIGCTSCEIPTSYRNSTNNLTPSFGMWGFAVLRYDGALEEEPPHNFSVKSNVQALDVLDARIKPRADVVVPNATVSWFFNTTKISPEVTWRMNGHLFHHQQVPVLFDIYRGKRFSEDSLIWTVPLNAVLDIVLYSFNNMDHPIHMHGHKFFLLGSGLGFNHQSARANLIDPPLLDTVNCPGNGWIHIRVQATVPGPWMLHCHLDFHTLEHMMMVLNVAPDTLRGTALPSGFPICDSFPNQYSPTVFEYWSPSNQRPPLSRHNFDADTGTSGSTPASVLGILAMGMTGGILVVFLWFRCGQAPSTDSKREVPVSL